MRSIGALLRCSRATAISGSAQSRIGQWFNTAAFAQPAAFSFGNESRTDPVLKAAGINNPGRRS